MTTYLLIATAEQTTIVTTRNSAANMRASGWRAKSMRGRASLEGSDENEDALTPLEQFAARSSANLARLENMR